MGTGPRAVIGRDSVVMSVELWEYYVAYTEKEQSRMLVRLAAMERRGVYTARKGLGFEITLEQFMEFTGEYDELKDVAVGVLREIECLL